MFQQPTAEWGMREIHTSKICKRLEFTFCVVSKEASKWERTRERENERESKSSMVLLQKQQRPTQQRNTEKKANIKINKINTYTQTRIKIKSHKWH